MFVAVLAASVEMRIVNDAGRCFACSDADQDEVKATVLTPVIMTMQNDSYSVAGDGVPPWINKRVSKTDSVALTSDRHVITGTFRL